MAPRPEIKPGASIAIFWDIDRKWYTGKVLNYNPATGICKVLYTDGEREELDLTAVKHRVLWAGKLRERMGKSGGGSSKKQPFEHIVETLLDIEDRLPPRGVYNNKKRWWSAWHSRVTNAGKSGNLLELGKAAVEIAFQMQDNVSTSWWKSQRLDWQKKVESSTTGNQLSSRLTDLLTKAVDWPAARNLFGSDSSESDRKENTVKNGSKDWVKGDRPGVDEKGTGRPGTRQQVMMVKENRDSKAGRKADEDSGVKKSTSNSTQSGVRQSKRKRIVEDDEDLSHVDSPDGETPDVNVVIDENRSSLVNRKKGRNADEGRLSDPNEPKSDKSRSEDVSHVDSPDGETPDVNLVIDENRSSLVKRKKGSKVDEGRLSDPNDHKSDKARSETDTQGDQSSVDDTKLKKYRRKRHSIEVAKQEQGTEDAQESAIDRKIQIGYSRVRRSKRSLEPEPDSSEAGRTSEITASGKKVPFVPSEPTLEAGNTIDLTEPEEITELKGAKIPVVTSPRRLQKSTGSNSIDLPEPEEITLLKGTKVLVRSSPRRLQKSAALQSPQKSGLENAASPKVLLVEVSSPTQECLSVKDRPQQLEQVPDVQVQRKRGRPKKINLEKEDGGDAKEKSRNGISSPAVSTAKNLGLSPQDSNVATPEVIVARVDTRLQKVGNIQDEIGCSTDPVGRVKREIRRPKKYDAAEVEGPKLEKSQSEGRQGRIGTRCESKQINLFKDDAGETPVYNIRRRKNVKSSELSDDIPAGKENGKNSAAKEKSPGGRKTTEPGKGQDGAGPSMVDSSVDITPKRRGRLVRKVSDSKFNARQGGEVTDPILLVEAELPASPMKQEKEHVVGIAPQDASVVPENEVDGAAQVKESQGEKPTDVEAGYKKSKQQKETYVKIDEDLKILGKRDPPGDGSRRKPLQREIVTKQARATASSARSERRRVRSGSGTKEVLDEDGTEESSEDEEQNGRVRYDRSAKRNSRKIRKSQSSDSNYEEKRNSRKIRKSQSSDSDYEETASGSSSEEDSDFYKVEDDAEHPDIMDSWGERLPTDDSEEDEVPSEVIKQTQLGQAELSLESPVTIQDWTLGEETCATCNFAGADELMLLCDQSGCTCAMHTFCLTPPLKSIPEGEWLCPHCSRLKANPSDARRLPKTCSSVKHPPKSLGSIIGRRREPLQEEGKTKIQYLVTWDSLSHEHDSWIPEDWLLHMNNRMVAHFQRKYPLSSDDANINVDERRPEWLRVDRIIACRKQGSTLPVKPSQVSTILHSRDEGKTGVEFLVKWHSLEHKCGTWEAERDTEEFQQAISSYSKRHERGEESGSREEEVKPVAAIKTQPDYLCGGVMYSFQLHGLKWLLSNYEQGRSVILADEMGLGKTIQALAFISCIRYEKLSSRPALVIAPKSTLPGWEQEFRYWSPGLNVVVYQGDKENRALIREYEFHTASKKPLFEVLLTSYELAALDNTLLSKFHWSSLIVDEGHRVKNIRAKLGTLLKRHTADFRLLLTGTPVQNTLTELFALLHFLDPKEFPDPEDSARQFTEVDAHGNNGQSDAIVIEQQVSKLHELLNPRMLRRLKTEVLRDLIPGKKLVEVSCAMTSFQRHLYSVILKRNFKVLNKGVKSGMKRSLQSILTDLKMVCNHPYLFPGKEPQQLEPKKAYKMMVEASGKLQLLEKLLPLLKEQGHRVLLFSQMTKMLDILEDFMGVLGLSYSRIDGSSSASSRQKSIAEFNAANSSTFIFLISTRAGGLGINLPSADTVIIYDPDFNPFVDLQAQARAHRIGQDKTVLVYQLITKCSVEEKILQRSRKKLAMENLVMSRESKETAADINTLLLHGAQKVLDECDIEATSIKFTDESVKKLLDRELLISTANDDEPTAHGYLGAVQGDGFFSPTVTEQEDQEAKGGDGSEWHELLHHMVEEDVTEDLGRGKRVRKQVVYAVEGHADGQEEDEYDPSSESESSSDSDLSVDSGGVSRKKYLKNAGDLGVGGVPTGEYPGMLNISDPAGTPGLFSTPGLFVPLDNQPLHAAFVPGDSQPLLPSLLNSTLHTSSMISSRGVSNSPQMMMGSAANMLPRPSQGAAACGIVGSTSCAKAVKLRERDVLQGLGGSISKASLPHRTSREATSSQAGSMLGDQFRHVSAGAVRALPNTPLLSGGAGLNGALHFTNPPVAAFQGVYPYVNNPSLNTNINPYAAAPSYVAIPGRPYTPYNAHPLPSQPFPSHYAQSVNTANPAWASFANLQQATQVWRMSDVERMSAIAVSGMARSAGRGGYMPAGGRGGSIVGGRTLPTTSSPSNFQSIPSSMQQSGSGAAHHQPLPNPAGKDKRVSYSSSHLSSAAAAPWLAGYCDVSTDLSCQVDHKVINSASLATPPVPVLVPAVSVMSAVPYIPPLHPAFEYHDPTVLKDPPTPIRMSSSASARVPEPLAGRAPAVVTSIPFPSIRKGTMTSHDPPAPEDSVKPGPPLDRNGSSSVVSPAEVHLITVPHVGAADSMPAPALHNRYPSDVTITPILPVPQILQSPVLGRTVGVPPGQTRTDVVHEISKGGGSTGQCQPAVALYEEQVVNEGGSNELSSAHQVEVIGLSSAPKQLPPQGRKPLWVPKGDAGLLMGHNSQDHGVLPAAFVKVEEGSSQEGSMPHPFTSSSQTRQTK